MRVAIWIIGAVAVLLVIIAESPAGGAGGVSHERHREGVGERIGAIKPIAGAIPLCGKCVDGAGNSTLTQAFKHPTRAG